MDTIMKVVNEAVPVLLSEMSGRDKLILRNTKKEDLILFHLTWSMEIRNKFDLWSGNGVLTKDVKVTHPDSVSTIIMEAVWEELQR